jgi:hypothetical protein
MAPTHPPKGVVVKKALVLSSVLLLSGLLGGCTGSAEESPSGSAASASTAASGTASSPAGADAASAAYVGIDPANPPKAIAEGTCLSSEAPVVSTKAELVTFEKRGKALLAVFRLTSPEKTSLHRACSWSPTLLDLTNLKKYPSASSLTTGYLSDLAANAPTYVYVGFKIPEGTDTVDIALDGRSVTMAGIKVPK